MEWPRHAPTDNGSNKRRDNSKGKKARKGQKPQRRHDPSHVSNREWRSHACWQRNYCGCEQGIPTESKRRNTKQNSKTERWKQPNNIAHKNVLSKFRPELQNFSKDSPFAHL